MPAVSTACSPSWQIDVDKRYTAMQTMEDKWMKNASSEILKGATDIKDRMKKMKGKQMCACEGAAVARIAPAASFPLRLVP